MLGLEVLIGKLGAIDGLATRAVVVGEVAALAHEAGDHAAHVNSTRRSQQLGKKLRELKK